MRKPGPARGGGEHLSPLRGQLPAAGHEVRVQVGLRRIGHREAPALRGSQVRAGIALRVDHERPAVTEIDKIGGIAQALVDQGDRLCRCRHRSPRFLSTMIKSV